MYKADQKDKKILNILQKNGRTSFADIAKELGIRSPSIIDRIKRMENEGIIEGYSASINYNKLGLDITAFVGVYMSEADFIEDFERNLSEVDEDIVECHHVTGDFTFILKVITQNRSSLSLLIKKLRAMQGITKTNTILIFSTPLQRTKYIK